MSYVFKQIDSSYKTVTPFYAHKRWILNTPVNETLNIEDEISVGEISMSILYGKYTQSQWIGPQYEEPTRNGEFSRNVWHSVNTLYYRNFQSNPFDYYKYGSIGVETRDISDVVQVFSIPQKIIGAGIKPGSFRLKDGASTFIDDGNGNILGYRAQPNTRVFNTSSKDFYYCSYFFRDAFKHLGSRASYKTKSHGNLRATVEWNLDSGSGIAAPVHGPNYLNGRVTNVGASSDSCPASKYNLNFNYDSTVTGSSYIRVYNAKELNFDTKDPLTISMWVKTSNINSKYRLIGKTGRRRVYRNPVNPQTSTAGINYNTYISDEVYGGSYPFSIEIDSGNIIFSISDGATTSRVSTSAGALNSWTMVTCRKNSGSMEIFINNSQTATAPCGCHSTTKNDADVFIGASGELITTDPLPLNGANVANGTGQFDGLLGPVHIFNRYLSNTEISDLYAGVYNNHYGNILYKQGLIIWTNQHGNTALSMPNKFSDENCSFSNMQFRSTRQITTNEYICVVGPGELNMTTNPSVLLRAATRCAPNLGSSSFEGPNEQGECHHFVTGSNFSPYITGIGLYNDIGELLVIGKLATPIKKPTNCDLVVVVKWDE